tara:strand:- start:1960 stop:2409 length:450 start_codon:yes stop_codon:yes gene_type:complete
MKIPNISWAQNQKLIYLNILIEPKDYKLDISDNILKFIQDDYEFKMEFKHDVDNNFKCNENRILEIDIIKVVPNFWDHLIKDHNSMKNNISINWDRWIDEDEDDDLLHLNLGSDTSEDDENLEYEQQTEPEAEIELGQESEPQTLNSSN